MVFSSYLFIFFFLPLALPGYYAPRKEIITSHRRVFLIQTHLYFPKKTLYYINKKH